MSWRTKRGWGTGVILLFGSFAVFVLSLAGFASFQQFHMVEDDYYGKQLKYQERIDKIKKTFEKPDRLRIEYDESSKNLNLFFLRGDPSGDIVGRIMFFRPSDPHLDLTVPIQPDESGKQSISTKKLAAGLWKLKIEWNVGNDGYYFEDILILE